jgi:hypothetical protein
VPVFNQSSSINAMGWRRMIGRQPGERERFVLQALTVFFVLAQNALHARRREKSTDRWR